MAGGAGSRCDRGRAQGDRGAHPAGRRATRNGQGVHDRTRGATACLYLRKTLRLSGAGACVWMASSQSVGNHWQGSLGGITSYLGRVMTTAYRAERIQGLPRTARRV